LFRLPLKSDGLSVDTNQIPTDTLHYLAGYRLRNVTVAPSGDTLFVAVDNSCCTLGPNSIIGKSVASPNLGFILRMVYLKTLSLDTTGRKGPPASPKEYKIYPNPARGIVHVQAPRNAPKPLLAKLYDVAGKPMGEGSSTLDDFTLDISALSPGFYILRLMTVSGIELSTQKLLVR
jgi:hypothetical protein